MRNGISLRGVHRFRNFQEGATRFGEALSWFINNYHRFSKLNYDSKEMPPQSITAFLRCNYRLYDRDADVVLKDCFERVPGGVRVTDDECISSGAFFNHDV